MKREERRESGVRASEDTHRPALVDEVHGERAQEEDEQHSDEHVVDGPDVADLKQLAEGQSQEENKYIHHQR